MKKRVIALIAGSTLVSAGAIAGGDKDKYGEATQQAPSAQTAPHTQTPSAQVGQSSETVRQAQQALAAQGFDPGPIDGKLGAKTAEAVKKVQKEKNLDETGQLDRQTLAALGVSETSTN